MMSCGLVANYGHSEENAASFFMLYAEQGNSFPHSLPPKKYVTLQRPTWHHNPKSGVFITAGVRRSYLGV
jgi:hypothetical protein